MRKVLILLLTLLPLTGFGQRRLPEESGGLHFPPEFWRAKPPTDTLTLYAVGDIMSHGAVIRDAAKNGYEGFFKHIEKDIQGADIAVGNMEFPLAGKPWSGYPNFSGPDAYAAYLSRVGFDVLLSANNHILDKGSAGAERTVRELEAQNIRYTGIADTPGKDTLLNPLILSLKGIRIAFVNFTYGTNLGSSKAWPKVQRMDTLSLKPVMERARNQADLILVFPHWGIEYAQKHSARQEETARWLIAQGAHAIVGAHPHVVQDVQWFGGVPVFYSLGNALSNQNDPPARLEAALTLRFLIRLGEPPRMLEPRLDFLWCTKPGMVEDSFSAVPVSLPESYWKVPSDYGKMISTLNALRVCFERNQ